MLVLQSPISLKNHFPLSLEIILSFPNIDCKAMLPNKTKIFGFIISICDFKKGIYNYSSTFMRFWNEGATLILFSIVFLVSIKNSFHWIFGVLGIIGLGVLLVLGIRFYKRLNNKNKTDANS